MNWDDLRIFLAVARAGQLARAAHMLGSDATTVGRRLRRLEQAVGQTLFERHRDGQKITEAGERLVAEAEQMERATLRMAGGGADAVAAGGVVRASVSEGFGTWFVSRHLPDFAASNPTIGIDLVASSGFLNPSRREADLAILLARPSRGPLVTRKLTDYRLGLYAARPYLERARPIRSETDLRRCDLIGYIPDLLYAPELNYLGEIGLHLEPRLRSSSINAQHRLAASGGGVAVLPCFMADDDSDLVRILPEIGIERSFWLVMHEDTRHQPRIRLFADWLARLVSVHRAQLLGAAAPG